LLVALSVMTYNVGNGLASPGRLADLLAASAADIIGLQELAWPQAEVLGARLSSIYPWQILAPTGFSGKGLLSRHPVVASEYLGLYPDRPDLRAVVELDGLSLSVLVAHPPPPRLLRTRFAFDPTTLSQLDALASLAVEHPPAILLGDFNMTRRNAAYARLVAAGLHDAFAIAGSGRGSTLPKRLGRAARLEHGLHGLPLLPVARVDYIWYTRGLRAEAAWVGGDAGSDHLPVLARLALHSI